jgi:hypothetical protein
LTNPFGIGGLYLYGRRRRRRRRRRRSSKART